MKILIDPGHGITTPGKQSPDRSFREWAFNRLLAGEIVKQAQSEGLDCELLFDSEADLPLRERIRLVNSYPCGCLVVSVHVNAAGSGSEWHGARGFCAYVGTKAGRTSRRLAAMLVREAATAGLCGNRAVPPEGYWTANFAICNRTNCPTVLTENLFMDNRTDLALLKDPATLETLAKIHINALKSSEYLAK